MLGHDDFRLRGHFQAVKQSLPRQPDAVMSVGPFHFADPAGTRLHPCGLLLSAGLLAGHRFVEALLVQNTVAVNGVIMRRDAFLQAGGFDKALWYTVDWDLYLKMAQRGAVDIRPQVTTAYRVHGNAQTINASRDIAEFRRQLDVVIDRHLLAFTAACSAIDRRARASIVVNCALALAASGTVTGVGRTLLRVLRLGPRQVVRFLAETRLVDRLRPRLRLALAGGF